MEQAGLIGLFDFIGYSAGLGSPQGGGFGMSVVEVFFMYHEQAIRQRAAMENARRIELMLRATEDAVYTKRYEEWKRNWSSTYTTLLVEL